MGFWSIGTGVPGCMFAMVSIDRTDLIEIWIKVAEILARALGVNLEHR